MGRCLAVAYVEMFNSFLIFITMYLLGTAFFEHWEINLMGTWETTTDIDKTPLTICWNIRMIFNLL